ncbi:MAG: troA [Armatimonadetes bacterium]|jgi:manganese/zinc/iron transport system substrate-binding protein|nr:troA [Armatimonadota bacterium]
MSHVVTRRAVLVGGAATITSLLAGALSGCEQGAAGNIATRKVRVTTTIGMIGDTVRNVGGERVDVTALMGPGVDPHLYKASEGDISRLQGADVIFYNGLNLEGKMADLFVKMAGSGKPTVAVSDGIDKSKLREPPEFHGHYDPHVWFDVSMWAQTIDPVVQALTKLDPTSKDLYEANARSYRQKLDELHRECGERMAAIPKAQRVLVTAHDAFGYFGRAYGVEVVGLQGISTVSEISLKDVQRLVDTISTRRIKAVFVESSVPKRSIEAVVQGCEARGHAVKIGGTLFSDAMGAAGTDAGTYPGMVRHNVETIVGALK